MCFIFSFLKDKEIILGTPIKINNKMKRIITSILVFLQINYFDNIDLQEAIMNPIP